ncbi:peptidase S8/S53 domain-containing protein [Plectosphaerella plurivora]|uniref:Peptidase S8/S53 domain-containing protein n=1 Tax=Plectosphaerella plurivora TaxID=936078 RepID=A0A9P9ACK4_9PEZI|nr:peptidase S8/S53 domain-containing protein [Plectosphaerella plurivora]
MSFSSFLVSLLALGAEAASDLALHARWVSDIHARSVQRRGDVGGSGLERTFAFPGFAGYVGSFDEETLEEIRANVNVTAVELDAEVQLASALTSQANPPWGLSAISHANPPVSDSDYIYDSSAGEGTFSYVFDSGILLSHVEFEGRAELGIDATNGAVSDRTHGTHVAGIVGGRTYGVAKKTKIIDVQVTGSSLGQFSWLLAGIEWATLDIAAKNRTGKAVINASLATSSSEITNAAWKAVIDAGIPVVAAAGNSNQDANDYSPANLPEAITVAASNRLYRRWSASNWGTAIDLFAPGQDIPSAWTPGVTDVHVTSGTSMAAPYVAGVIAYLLALEGRRTPAEIKARVLELATEGVIENLNGSPNVLLYNGNGA